MLALPEKISLQQHWQRAAELMLDKGAEVNVIARQLHLALFQLSGVKQDLFLRCTWSHGPGNQSVIAIKPWPIGTSRSGEGWHRAILSHGPPPPLSEACRDRLSRSGNPSGDGGRRGCHG